MALSIHTFSNVTGGSSFFKAIGHPLAVERIGILIGRAAAAGPVALYDPHGNLPAIAELYDLSTLDVAGVYVQRIEDLGETRLGRAVRPVTALPESGASAVLVLAYDSVRLCDHIAHLVPPGARVMSLDEARLPEVMLSDRKHYLANINWATNHGFLRDQGGRHTRIATANYWGSYGAAGARLWLRLFDAGGAPLATWEQPLGPALSGVVIDSAEIRARFGLGEFAGTLFMHVIAAAGHDVVKYALDTWGDDPAELSCTHDANAWPADLYAGLPAPGEGERVLLWLQNAHPSPIPGGGIGLNLMGGEAVAWVDGAIPGFGCRAVDVAALLPDARWPAQIEVKAGRHVVRPRYEVTGRTGRNRIAHVNVERTDLKADPAIPGLAATLGKGYLLPAPVLPPERYETLALPTPMSTAQTRLPMAAVLYDAEGTEVARHRFGVLGRDHTVRLAADDLLRASNRPLAGGYGHLELAYDFADGGEDAADGWLHGLFRYVDRSTGHAADTSFGAHIFNGVMTYRGEPQNYAGPPPGLSTRLFLRVGPSPLDTICHLIYPASTPWHPLSDTRLILTAADGQEMASASLAIPCGGSRLWRVSETFDAAALADAGAGCYVTVRDTACRLFGYHGLVRDGVAFSLDHMFGF